MNNVCNLLRCSRNYRIKSFKKQPPLKNFPSIKAWTPSSSSPTTTKLTPWASSWGFNSRSSSDAQARHNCHPHRRRKAMTTVCFSHNDDNCTSCPEVTCLIMKSFTLSMLLRLCFVFDSLFFKLYMFYCNCISYL